MALRRGAALGTLVLLLAAAGPARALVLQLGSAEIEQAIVLGRQSVADEEFGDEWRRELPDGAELAVTTPFLRVVQAARVAAFKGEALGDKQRNEAIDRGKGKIQLTLTTYGRTIDFTRWYQPVLLVAGKEVKAVFTQNERTARRLDDGRFQAHNIYVFPLEEVPARGTVTLLVRHAIEQKELFRASLDLGKVR